MSTQEDNHRFANWSHIAQVIAIPVGLLTVAIALYQARGSLEASHRDLEQSTAFQETALCQAYREQVINLLHDGYTAADIRQTFLGEHDDVTKPASEVNNVYDRYYAPQCGDIEIITRRLSSAPPNERSQR
jgi:hypothetical protein